MYDVFSDSINKEGGKMVKDLNKVVAYQMTDQNKIVVIDLKNKPNGHIFTSNDPSSIPVQPDLTLKMKRQTFDELAEGKIGRVTSVINGKIRICGSLSTLQSFNSKIVNKYLHKETAHVQE